MNYKFVTDNADKNVKPSFQRDEIKGGYCVQDRVDTSTLCDREPQFRKADPLVMVPSQSDIANVKDEMVIFVKQYAVIYRVRIINFVCRIIAQHFDQYKECEKDICMHIPSKYSTEMAAKSKVVCMYTLLIRIMLYCNIEVYLSLGTIGCAVT